MQPDHPHPPLDNGGSAYSWIRHFSPNETSIDQFPTATGPIVYEGFVPQQMQYDDAGNHGFPGQSIQVSPQQDFNHYDSRYPPLDFEQDVSQSTNEWVRPASYSLSLEHPNELMSSRFGSSSQLPRSLAATRYDAENDDTSMDDDSDQDDADHVGTETEDISTDAALWTRGLGRIDSRGRGAERRAGRHKKGERQRGGWNRGTKTGPRPVLDPGEDFKALHKEATEAFIDRQDYDTALELILRAISINPEIYSAHVLLSEIYFARNDDERGIAALFSGAHAAPNDPAVWQQLADVCLQRSSMDRFTMLKQASYCFQRLLQIDSKDHDARFQKAAISRELGHHAKALKDLDILLRKMPHNSSILRQIAEVCLDINDVGRAIGLYDQALEHHRLSGSWDKDAFTWADLIVYVDLIAHQNGVVAAIKDLKDIARWLAGRPDENFWEVITEDDREWDADDVPRRVQTTEFTPGIYARDKYGIGLPLELRIKLGDLRLRNGDREEALYHFEWLAPDDRDEGAPIYDYSDLFLQVADMLREVKEYERALVCYEALYSTNACDDADFWLGFGACSYICGKNDQALHCYEEAKRADPTSGEARTQLSKLYAAKGDREGALLLARSAITIFENNLPQTERRKYERKDLREAREAAQDAYKQAYKLPKPSSGRDNMPKPHFSKRARAKARQLARDAAQRAAAEEDQEQQQLRTERRENSLTPPRRQDGLRSREEAMKKITKRWSKKEKTAQDRVTAVKQLHSTLCSVTKQMRDGDDVGRNVWMDCADALVEQFRSERAFYPGERYLKFRGFNLTNIRTGQSINSETESAREDVPLPSVEAYAPDDYCGISFPEWLEIFLEYAVLLASIQEDRKECYAVIQAALDCNVWYHDLNALVQVHTCWLVCALALRDENTIFSTVIRWFMREFTFCTDTYRLFGALNFYFPHPNDKGGKMGQMNNAVFRASPNQKYLFRQIISLDSLLPEGYGAEQPDGPVPEFMRKSRTDILYLSDRFQRQAGLAQSQQADGDLSPSPMDSAGESGVLRHRLFTPKELDVVLLTLYAQTLYAGNSFPNALSYYYRAYTLDPKNTVVLLSISLCYMHQMFKRQNENRHMYMLQGWSFFERYAEARIEWADNNERTGMKDLGVIVRREIEFNRARCWQMLGMNDLAIRSYGAMMDIKAVKTEDETGPGGVKDAESFSMEAAYAMASIYAVNGDIENARSITEKYLVVE